MQIVSTADALFYYHMIPSGERQRFELEMKVLYEKLVEIYKVTPKIGQLEIFHNYEESDGEAQGVIIETFHDWIYECYYDAIDKENIYGLRLDEMTEDMLDEMSEGMSSEFHELEEGIVEEFKTYLRVNNFHFFDMCNYYGSYEAVNSPLQEVW